MFKKIALTELKKNIKSPAFYIFTLVFLLGALLFSLITDSNSAVMGISHGKEFHNAPLVIAQIATRFSVFGVLFSMIILGRAIAKDYEAGIHEIIFSYPVSKFDYLGGRFFGAFMANILLFFGIFLGFELAFLIIDPKFTGSFRIGAYLLPFIFTLIPNTLLIGSLFFRLATISRKLVSTYLAGIAFLAIYGIVAAGFRFIDSDTIKILIDPFGINGLNVLSKYWTVADMNRNLMPINNIYILNRVIWIGISVLILAGTFRKFKFIAVLEGKKEKNKIEEEIVDNNKEIKLPEYLINYSFGFHLKQCLVIAWIEMKRILMHPAFLILTFLAISQIITNFVGNVGNGEGSIYPFTSWYLNQTIHLSVYMIPMAIFFGGMLVWKEKDSKSDEIYNTLPVSNWLSYFSKFLTLAGVQIFYLILAIIAGVLTQVLFYNFTDIELGLYFTRLFGIDFINYLHMIIIVLLIQILSPNKYIGFFLSALYFAADLIIFGAFGYENILLRYGNVPKFIYSNLNGFGHFTTSIVWYTIYWAISGIILIMLSIGLWRRTLETNLKYRFKYLRHLVSRKQLLALSILLILFISTGSFIAYNRYIVSPYLSEDDRKQMQADYETKFQKYDDKAQPTIKHIDLKVDLYPHKRKVLVNGTFQLQNISTEPIDSVFINLNDWNINEFKKFEFDKDAELQLHANEFGFRIFKLTNALEPNQTIDFNFEYIIDNKGFTDNLPKNEIAENGTYLVLSGFSAEYFPVIGYNPELELNNDKDRKDLHLHKKPDLPSIYNADRTKVMSNLSRPTYAAILSTSADQEIISNGNLVKRWQENNRNYFHYRSDIKMENEIAIVSGRYEAKKENYKGVNVEVYYHKNHHYNVDRIMEGLKDSYDYNSQSFSGYPFKDLRVVEIPAYMQEGGARHFPTVFIWKETAGFITNYENGQEVDIVYGIAAHENAHHWWAGLVTPAYAEGGYVLTETLCQYVMAMAHEKKYGIKMSRKYLKEEMNQYLRRRKKDLEGEKPLVESNFQQQYIGYKKSTSAMYALQDYIGEDSVNKALSRIVEKYGERLDTFALATVLVDEFEKVTPDSLQYLVHDLFYKITLYENEILGANCTELESGKFQVDLKLKSAKFYVDSIGNQTETSINDYIYVALMDEDDNEFYYRKHKFDSNEKSIQIITDQKPAKAGLDPYLVLIDRNMENNKMKVREL